VPKYGLSRSFFFFDAIVIFSSLCLFYLFFFSSFCFPFYLFLSVLIRVLNVLNVLTQDFIEAKRCAHFGSTCSYAFTQSLFLPILFQSIYFQAFQSRSKATVSQGAKKNCIVMGSPNSPTRCGFEIELPQAKGTPMTALP
jgi:hypothetical protein